MYVFVTYLVCLMIGKDLAAAGDEIKICAEESTNEKNPVLWPSSFGNDNKLVSSRPLCLSESQELITRLCTQEGWSPKQDEVPDCFSTQSRASTEQCPPGYNSIINKYGKINFCYQLTEGGSWDYPCFNSGSSLTIFDLEFDDMEELLSKLNFEDRKLVWLPAKRSIPYGPIVWTLPGEKWGETVEISDNYITRLPAAYNCLLAELGKYSVKSENCSFMYPALCLFEKNHLLSLHCPRGYKAAKYGHNDGMCYGLEIQQEGIAWQDFKKSSCSEPLQILSKVENNLVSELANAYNYKLRNLCWTGLMQTQHEYYWYPDIPVTYINWDAKTEFNNTSNGKGVLSRESRWLLKDENSNISCMACQMRVDFKEAEISLQVTTDPDIIHLIIYNSNTLWKEKLNDPGVNCFTNANGFVQRVEIDDEPYRRVQLRFQEMLSNADSYLQNIKTYNELYSKLKSRYNTYLESEHTYDVEKAVFEVRRINDESGEYWCEGHNSHNFSLVQSSKIIVASKTTERHDFVLKLKILNICPDISTCKPDWEEEAETIQKMLSIKSAKFMKIDSIETGSSLEVTVHMNVLLLGSITCVDKQCKIIQTYNFLLEMCEITFARSEKYDLIHIKSTEFCLPCDESDDCPLHWSLTHIGGNVAPQEFCMQSNGLPVTRKCMGAFLEGATWGPVEGNCSENFEPTNRTSFLYRLAKGWEGLSTASSFLTRDFISILDNKADLIPADIYFLAMSLKTIVQISDYNDSLIELGDSTNLANAINSIMDIDENFLNLAQTMNSSNILLESIDILLSKIALNDTFPEMEDTGIDIAITPQFLTHISSPYINNISGVALARRPETNSSLFTDLDIISLTTNMTIFDILAIPNLEIATWLSQDLIDSIKFVNVTNSTSEGTVKPKILIQAFYSDIIFQETKTNKDIINSRVVSVSVPGYESDLPLPLIMIYRRLDLTLGSERSCAYWDFGNSPHSEGQWSKQGCYHLASHDDLDVCACLHLTHFAQLVVGSHGGGENGGDVIILYYHGRALNAITLVGCSLSLVGVAGIAATAIVFPAWRQKAGSKVLLQLSAALGLQSMMMLSQDAPHESDNQCIALGALMHYSVLAAFMWMLLTALLQFARYVKVLGVQRPVRFMLKFSIAGWGLPILPVAILLIIDPRAYLPPPTYIPISATNSTELIRDPSALCYPQGLNLYLTVLLPVLCIVLTNLTVFVMVMRSIIRGPDGKRRSVDPDLVISQLRLSVLLFFLLGLSWIFGLFAATGGQIVFSYLFCLTATLQGFVLFIYFIVCDPATRVLWVSLVRERSKISNSSTREISTVK